MAEEISLHFESGIACCWLVNHDVRVICPAYYFIRASLAISLSWRQEACLKFTIIGWSALWQRDDWASFVLGDWALSQYIKTIFPGMGIPMLKIRWSRDHLIFNMGIPILVSGIFILRRPQEVLRDERNDNGRKHDVPLLYFHRN